MRVLIVVPTLNEAKHIEGVVEHLVRDMAALPDARLVIADGGSDDGAEPAGMLRFDVRQEHRVEPSNRFRPHRLERLDAGTGVEKDRVRGPVFGDEIRVRHPDSVWHAQRPYAKWQRPELWFRIASAAQRTQPHFVQFQHRGD